jgi:hypothetical protein
MLFDFIRLDCGLTYRLQISFLNQDGDFIMAKGDQRSNKMAKKPKKDTSPPKNSVPSDRPSPPMTAVLPKGKEKYK